MSEESLKGAINRVKEAEARSEAIAREAQELADRIVLDARMEAQELADSARAQAMKSAGEISENATAGAEKEIEKISKNTVMEKGAIGKKAESTLDKAAHFISERALGIYGGSEA